MKYPVQAPAVHRSGTPPDPHGTAVSIAHRLAPELYAIGAIGSTSLKLFGSGVHALSRLAPFHEPMSAANSALELGKRVAELGHDARHSRDAANALKAAPIHLQAMVQSGRDVQRIRRDILIFEKLVEHRGSQKAAELLPRMKSSLMAAQATWERERSAWNGYRRISETYGRVQATNVGKVALAVEETLQSTSIGRGLIEAGRLVEHGFGFLAKGIVTVGACIALAKGVQESSARTVIGRGVDGALSAGATIMVDYNPLVALPDLMIKKTFGDKNSLEHFYHVTAHNVTALTESAMTGDLRPLSAAHESSMKGENGRVMQIYANMGDVISKSSLVDSSMTRVADFLHGVPSDLRQSTAWWSAAPQQKIP